MSLLDTIDGSFMNFAYGWAFSKPVRKVFYNLTVTGLSVAVALVIGTIELLSIAVERLDLTGGFWDWVAGIDLNAVGYVVVGLFVATWAVALAVWRFGHLGALGAAGGVARVARGGTDCIRGRESCVGAAARASITTALLPLDEQFAQRATCRSQSCDPLLQVVRNSTQNAPRGWGARPGGELS